KREKAQGGGGEGGGGGDSVAGCPWKPAQSVAPDGIINFRTLGRHHLGSPSADARRTATGRAVGCEIFRMLLFGLPSARSCVAWIRRSGKIVRGIVQPDRDQVLLVEQPGELKYTEQEGDQQRYHYGTFDQRRSLLVEPERWLSSRNHVAVSSHR